MKNVVAKVHDSYFLIQYFDFVISGQKQFSIPTSLPDLYVNLFSLLNTYAKRRKTLSNQSAYLFMKEAYGTCTIILHCIDVPKRQSNILFRIEFPKEKWTYIEDLFLSAGLAVCKRSEKRIVHYEFQTPNAQCELLTEDKLSSFTIKAPDEKTLIECLGKVGKFLDKGEIRV